MEKNFVLTKHANLEIHPEVYLSSIHKCIYSLQHCGAREMAQWLSLYTALPEDPSLVPSTQVKW